MQPPASGASFVDPAFGTAIFRASDALNTPDVSRAGSNLPWIETEYSTACPFNSDNSCVLLLADSYFRLRSLVTGFQGDLLLLNATSEPRWSRTDPDTLYFHVGNALKSLNVVTGAVAVIHAFTEYAEITGKGESDISEDGTSMVFCGDDKEVFVYNLATDSKGPVIDVAGIPLDSLYLTPSNGVLISWDPATPVVGTYFGIDLFQDGVFQRKIFNSNGHKHCARLADGTPVLVITNSNENPVTLPDFPNGIVIVDLATGKQNGLLSLDWSLAVHISAADIGWAFVETYNPTNPDPPAGWFPYTNELLAIKLGGSVIGRLAHHRSRPNPPGDTYNYMPKCSCSRDGSLLAFGSNFGLSAQPGTAATHPPGYADAYWLATGVTPIAAPVTPVPTATPLSQAKQLLQEALTLLDQVAA
jgi:hypothetical protein